MLVSNASTFFIHHSCFLILNNVILFIFNVRLTEKKVDLLNKPLLSSLLLLLLLLLLIY